MLAEPTEEDEVRRLRRVREEMHNRFRTWKSFWAYVDSFAKGHGRASKPKRKGGTGVARGVSSSKERAVHR